MFNLDIEELAWRAIGKTDEEYEEACLNANEDIDDAIYEKYECSFEVFASIVNDLIKFTPILTSPLSNEKFHAFVDASQGRAILKAKIKKNEFPSSSGEEENRTPKAET